MKRKKIMLVFSIVILLIVLLVLGSWYQAKREVDETQQKAENISATTETIDVEIARTSRNSSSNKNVNKDLKKHVQGMEDRIVKQDQVVNWLAHISYDETIKTVIYDATDVENEPGVYPLVYTILGVDGTIWEEEIQVTVKKNRTRSSQLIANEQEACTYIENYLKKENKYIPSNIEFDHMDEYGYVIHGYDIVDFHTATSFWYSVSSYGKIYDTLIGEYIN